MFIEMKDKQKNNANKTAEIIEDELLDANMV